MEIDPQKIRQSYAAYGVIDPHDGEILTYVKVFQCWSLLYKNTTTCQYNYYLQLILTRVVDCLISPLLILGNVRHK